MSVDNIIKVWIRNKMMYIGDPRVHKSNCSTINSLFDTLKTSQVSVLSGFRSLYNCKRFFILFHVLNGGNCSFVCTCQQKSGGIWYQRLMQYPQNHHFKFWFFFWFTKYYFFRHSWLAGIHIWLAVEETLIPFCKLLLC